MIVYSKNDAPSTHGTYLVGYIRKNYNELVSALGEPTFKEPSTDGKTQVEWVVELNGNLFTIYDWKTYDRDYTLNELDVFNVGGKTPMPESFF